MKVLSKKLLCLVFVSYVLAASVANMCGRKQLLFHSNHVFVIGVKQNYAVLLPDRRYNSM
jgi:hypothetical protein